MNIYLYVICGMLATFLLCTGTILFYLKYRKNILQKQYELKTAALDHQKELLKAIINSQEEERKRIGMDLHDEVGSKLSLLRLTIDLFENPHPPGLSLPVFKEKCKSSIDTIVSSVRNISHHLSPILDGAYELYDALEDYCDEISQTGKLQIDITVNNGAENISLEYLTKLSLYRVIAELINNTIKHAEAQKATIDFSVNDSIYSIQYHDNGKGLQGREQSVRKGIGFKNIESRLETIGATQVISTGTEDGFHIIISLPLNKTASQDGKDKYRIGR